MAKKRTIKNGNPDFRRQHQTPSPSLPQIEEELFKHLQPCLFTPLKYLPGTHDKLMRDRLLNLPVMVALMLSIVYRQIAGLSEAVRLLQEEGLLWVKPLKVTKQALSKRLLKFPAEIFVVLLNRVLENIASRESKVIVTEQWAKIRKKFTVLWIADGSTLERIRKRLKDQEEKPSKFANLGGKIMMIVEVFTQNPVTVWYQENAKSHDQNWWEEIVKKLPIGGLIILDLGFFNFTYFDRLTEAKKFFLTRLKANTSYQVKRVLSQGTYYKDEIIKMGNYRSTISKHPVRLVSVLWGKTWYHYITNVLDEQQLSPQEVCELYRRRWRIEDAFLLTKRLLGLSYLWVGQNNGVQIQLIATLIFYTILNQLVSEVAITLNQPKEKISVEMVFRSLYYVASSVERGENPDAATYLAERSQLFGLVKATRKRHRERDKISQQIWDAIPLS
jgi:hypothetical protein